MVTDSDEKALRSRSASAGLIADYATIDRRLDLINRYNYVVGAPSGGVARVQRDFITDQMAPEELVAFVLVCEGLIAGVERSGG